jgi:hypothetical protein
MEYQHEPRIVREIVWDNPWWKPRLERETLSTFRNLAKAARIID